MAKKVTAVVKLQLPAGKANPAPPVGPALGATGINIMGFCKEYNERTAGNIGMIIPVEITVFSDRSFTFITKTPPAADLLRKAARVEKGSSTSGRAAAGSITPRPVERDRSDQDERLECARCRGCREDYLRYGSLDGHHNHGIAWYNAVSSCN